MSEESLFTISPQDVDRLAGEDMVYYIVVCKDDEEKVRAAMKQHSEIEVVGYVDRLAHIVATPGKVQFVGTKKAQPIRWEARRDSAVSAYFNRRIY